MIEKYYNKVTLIEYFVANNRKRIQGFYHSYDSETGILKINLVVYGSLNFYAINKVLHDMSTYTCLKFECTSICLHRRMLHLEAKL